MWDSYWKRFFVHRYENIKKSEHDKKSYKGFILSNEMKVLLISDPTISMCACTLNIKIGSFSDPDDLPGLAHLCERMLVLGTLKYSSYKMFQTFITNRGGYYDAITLPDETFYFFEINTTYFEHALYQYRHFFLNPLFNEEWIKTEINLLDLDHRKFLMDNSNRLREFVKSTAKSNHPYSRFAFGNKESLKTIPEKKGINVRSKLLEFYKKYYSANIMTLCILSNEPLDQIEDTVIQLFCRIPNNNIEIPLRYDNPFEDKCCTKWYIVPKDNSRILRIIFPLPEIPEDYWLPALNFIISLLKYEGKGSIFAMLEETSWIKKIKICRLPHSRGNIFLMLECILTESGVLCINSFIEILFEYLNMLKNENNLSTSLTQPLPILHEMFINHVVHQKHITSFKSEDTAKIAKMMHIYPIEKIPLIVGPDIVTDTTWEHNQGMINWILSKYISPQKIRVYVFAKEYENEVNRISPDWSAKAKYKEERIPEEIISTWQNISRSRFHLPSLNGFIAQYN